MRFSTAAVVAGAGVASVNAAALQGFNYGATLTSGAVKQQSDFEADFKKAQNLPGTSGWTSARLYTSIQGNTANDPISAIPAAIATNTKLLLGIWASSGQEDINNEIAAIENAISMYGNKFTDLVVGLSVGSEDLYRISPTGIKNKSGVGAGPATLVDYINQVKAKNFGFPIGHVDTWNDWTNTSNSAVIEAVDWVGFDGYPYFESTLDNPIENGESLFDASFQATIGAAQGKPVWMTETGWPVSGPVSGQAVASVQNAEKYWQAVACKLIGEVNTFWYTLRDAEPTTPSPSFGIIGSDINSSPLYDLSCSKNSTSSSSSKASSSSTQSASKVSTSSSSASTAAIVGGGAGGHGSSANATSSSNTAMVPAVTGTGSSSPSSSGNGTAPSYSAGPAGSPAGSASPSSTSSAYTGDAASISGFSSLAAIIAFIGLVAHA